MIFKYFLSSISGRKGPLTKAPVTLSHLGRGHFDGKRPLWQSPFSPLLAFGSYWRKWQRIDLLAFGFFIARLCAIWLFWQMLPNTQQHTQESNYNTKGSNQLHTYFASVVRKYQSSLNSFADVLCHKIFYLQKDEIPNAFLWFLFLIWECHDAKS